MSNQQNGAVELTGPAAGPSESAFVPARVLTVVVGWTSLMVGVIGSLMHPIIPGGWLTLIGFVALLAIPAFVFMQSMARGEAPSAMMRLGVIRPFWYVQMSLPFIAGAALIGALAGWPFGSAMVVGQAAVLLTITVFAFVALFGFWGSRRLVTRELTASFENLPAGLEGMRIVQISDLHVGPHTSKRHLANIAQAVKAAKPDLIAITGDQVDDYTEDMVHFEKAFGAMEASLGVFAVAGNHDVYAGWTGVRKGMEAMGINVLVNESIPLTWNGAPFRLAGTGDPAGMGFKRNGGSDAAPDIERTMAEVGEDAFSVVMAHNPALWPALVAHGANVTLSGHTHHGQFSIPRWQWSLASPFLDLAMGAHRKGDSWLYINPGTNFWGLPFRIGALPEVTVVTLGRE